MAVGIRTVATAQSTASLGVSSISIAGPTGLTVGDVELLYVAVAGGTGQTISPPAGWTSIKRVDSTTSLAVEVFWRVCAATGSITVSWTSNGHVVAHRQAFTGADTSAAPSGSLVSGQANASSTTVTIPALGSFSSRNGMDFAVSAISGDDTFTPPTSYTESGDSRSSNGVAGSRKAAEGAYRSLTGVTTVGSLTSTAASTAGVNIGVHVFISEASSSATGTIASSFPFSTDSAGYHINGTSASLFPFSTDSAGYHINGTTAVSFSLSASVIAVETITGSANTAFSLSASVTGYELLADLAPSFSLSISVTAVETITGTLDTAFSFSTSATGYHITGSSASVFDFSTSVAAVETITGSSGNAFDFSVSIVGDSTLAAPPVDAVLAPAFAFSVSSSGEEHFSASVSPAFSFSPDVTGGETFAAVVAPAFSFSTDTVMSEGMSGDAQVSLAFQATISGEVWDVAGDAALAFEFSSGSEGVVDAVGSVDVSFGFEIDILAQHAEIRGPLDVSFTFSTSVTGTEGVAGRAAPRFSLSVSVAGVESVTGTAGCTFGYAVSTRTHSKNEVYHDGLIAAFFPASKGWRPRSNPRGPRW